MKKLLLFLLFLALLLPATARTEGLPMESGPGQRGSHVMALEEALIAAGYLEGPAAGVFSHALTTAVTAFQKDQGLAATGRADRDTLRLLFLKPPPGPGDTQMPAWYGGGDALIPWGAQFEVKDIKTGIVFTVYRLMGKSHLDAEPLTAEDTALMKEAYGGSWSWARRPILVRYQGQVYAASMNGMPHGYYSNRKNRMEGHFCIHFFESRGDTSQRIDSDHLNTVFEASFSRWEDWGE